jgi:hypothetical protein
MPTEALKGFLRIGFFVGGCGFIMIFMQTPGTAEFVLSVCSALIGFTLVAGVIVLYRIMNKAPGRE